MGPGLLSRASEGLERSAPLLSHPVKGVGEVSAVAFYASCWALARPPGVLLATWSGCATWSRPLAGRVCEGHMCRPGSERRGRVCAGLIAAADRGRERAVSEASHRCGMSASVSVSCLLSVSVSVPCGMFVSESVCCLCGSLHVTDSCF